MNGIFVRWLTLTVAIILTAYLFDGIHVSGFFSAFFAAAMLGILNALFRPIALVLTLPINILTLGLFTFVINALMLKMASGVIAGFEVYGFWSAVFGSLMISVISWLLNSFINDQGTVTYYTIDRRKRHPSHGRQRSDSPKDTIDLEHKGDDRWE
ncbi:MAG: phage holin family protein [Desulfobacterales bacterium]|nr:MAG: phage holin family protein [Desulfobacterales bacterium]